MCIRDRLDWMLLDYDKHAELQNYVRTLNAFYKEHPALWQIDYSWEGFQWICLLYTSAQIRCRRTAV